MSKVKFINKFKNCFEGCGTFDTKCTLKLKDNANQIVKPAHRVPNVLYPKLKECLERLVEKKLIQKVDYPVEYEDEKGLKDVVHSVNLSNAREDNFIDETKKDQTLQGLKQKQNSWKSENLL